ncbi:hypothetical protein [Mycolicibacterium aubagnense]|uniref:Uncharacterized protein n=1 Tax=Mycolicibacterium aubagnense TaxID=319707 RepID=A0ABM7INA2_9MYCO|nr:hypothetical protein [Mycolicibacterium aubagnense]TLH62347.1 hypothetical protein C1S80_15185 [Mycolicibacterium aubagnense]BBX88195.1 hypothetical protein MAUB_63960 [Mycolicibacterium aubagnense]
MTPPTLLALTAPLPLHPAHATHAGSGGGLVQHFEHTFVSALGWYSGRALVEQLGLAAIVILGCGYLAWRFTKGRNNTRSTKTRP